MEYRIFWIIYENNPLNPKKGEILKFETKEKAIEFGSNIIREYINYTLYEESEKKLIDYWQEKNYIYRDSKWEGFKIELFTEREFYIKLLKIF